MSTNEIINLIVAILVSAPLTILVTQALKRPGWPPVAKALLAIVFAAGFGVAQTWISGELVGLIAAWGTLTAVQVIAYVAAVYAAATLEYNLIGGAKWLARLGEWPG